MNHFSIWITPAILLALVSFPTIAGERIEVKRAIYRADRVNSCDATEKVKYICDGNESCTVEANNELCGDPSYGITKKLKIEYSCGKKGSSKTIVEGSDGQISCR